MGINKKYIHMSIKNSITIELKGKIVDITVSYSSNLHSIYNKSLSEKNDYKKAFFITIYEMICGNKDVENLNNITIEDIEDIKIEDLERIAENIIDSSGIIRKLMDIEEFNNSDCFKKIYLMNKQLNDDFEKITSKMQSDFCAFDRKISGLSEIINYPLKNMFSQVEGLGKIYSQNLNIKKSIGLNMKPLIELSEQMKKVTSTINFSEITALAEFQSRIQKSVIGSNTFNNINVSFGIANKLQKQIEPFTNILQLKLIELQNSIPKIGVEMEFASKMLKLHSVEFDKIISNINSTNEVLMSSNINGIRSIILETQIGQRLLENQLKGLKQSLNLGTKVNYGEKLISFDNLYKSVLNEIKPFIIDLNSVILSRNSIKESIKNKAMKMNSFDWWIISSLPIGIVDEIDKYNEKLDRDKVDCIMCNFYSENNFEELDKFIDKWIKLNYFKNRIDILRDSIEVHKLGKYTLTVPTLIPIIEGVIREFMLDKYSIFSEGFKPIYRGFKDKVDELSNFLVSYVIACIDKLYCRFNPIKPNEVDDFSRHKISHGLATEYASEANSLKIILLLDEIFEIISAIQKLEFMEVR